MPRLALRNKLLLFAVVIAIIPLLIAGQSLIRIARDEMKSSANEQLVATTRQVADEIDTYFEQTLMAPLLLIRSALDDEKLGIEEKIALLTHGIADLTDMVALQITIEGGNLPLVVSQDRYADELRAAGVDPLTVLRTAPDVMGAFIASGGERRISVDYVPETGDWIATVMLPLEAPVANQRAAFSARVDLARLREAVEGNPFRRTGTIDIVDAGGRQVLGDGAVDLSARAIVQDALRRIETGTPVVAVESYTRPDGEPALGAFAVPGAIPWAVLVEKSEADAYFAVGQMIQSLGIWIAVGLVAAAIGALVFAFRISRPILRIGEAATEVGKGNFAARVTDVHTRDEIGDLASRINTMIVQINERFQLAKFVSGGTIAAIQKSDSGGVRLGGERREVAILFADIRGYTTFAEPRSPETVVEVLNSYFQRLADVVSAHRGDIDKYVGDQIMAVFLGEEMAADSTACCLAIQDVMDELKARHPEWGLDIGIGVDMGDVVMGAMGSKERMDYTVLGDHVNLAARLCSYAAARQSIVSEAVAEKVRANPAFQLEALEPIRVKGKSGALNVYSVTRGAGASDRAAMNAGVAEKVP
jgi:adenylate cyclase